MRKTFKYRIYPNKKIKRILNNTLETCRFIYNKTLEIRINEYKENNKTLSLYDTNKLIPEMKEANPNICEIYSQIPQEVQLRVDLAFKNFFRRIKTKEKPGFPRFKSKDCYDSFTYKQNNGSFKIIDNKWLKLSKIGNIQIKYHRPIEGLVKNCIVRRNSTGKWFVSFSCDVENHNILKPNEKSVGIDLGLTTFAVGSDNLKIKNPKFFKTSEKALAKSQRKLEKMVKGSEERTKQKKVIGKIHEKLSNKRNDFCHKESLKIVRKYQNIFLEDLDIKGMLKNKVVENPLGRYKEKLIHKGISNVCWNQFVNFVVYKAVEAGRTAILVNPKNTSQMCSKCGTIVKKTIEDRIHNCPSCGLKIDRDLNASYNILRLGLESLHKQASPA